MSTLRAMKVNEIQVCSSSVVERKVKVNVNLKQRERERERAIKESNFRLLLPVCVCEDMFVVCGFYSQVGPVSSSFASKVLL